MRTRCVIERRVHQSGSGHLQRGGTQQSRLVVALTVLAVGLAGCGTQIGNILSGGDAFIVKGTAEVRNVFLDGTCLAWVDTTGAVYQLFQGENVSNADFDHITTAGVTSRLQLTVREDLIVGCRVGTTAVVDAVLEVIP